MIEYYKLKPKFPSTYSGECGYYLSHSLSWVKGVKLWRLQTCRHPTLLFEALMKLVQLQWKSFLNKNLPSLMIYVHKNQCQLFHISNGIICLTN